MRRPALLMALVCSLLAACTATDSSSGPVATPRPTSGETPLAVPSPVLSATPTASEATSEGSQDERTEIAQLLEIGFTLNIARAGGDQLAPGSTLYAIARSIDEGANVIELDVRLTADRALVVHDLPTVDATTEATGAVSDLALEEIQRLDSAYWFSPDCLRCRDLADEEYPYRGVRTGTVDPPPGFSADDFRVATFSEVVQRFSTTAFDIEIKGSGFDALAVAQALAEEIAILDIADSVVVMSLDDNALGVFEVLAPEVQTSPGPEELDAWILEDEPLRGSHRVLQVPTDLEGVDGLSDTFWARAQRDNLDVWVWVPDDSASESLELYQELIAAGANGVIAARPNEMSAATL